MTDEFDIIHRCFEPLTRGNTAALALSDDAAVLIPRAGYEQVVTTDAIVAGVHFLEGEDPSNIAARLCGSNLSDLAAMGAVPVGFTLACAWTKGTDVGFIQAFAGGLGMWVDDFDFPLLGGDTVTTPGPMMFSLTAIGEVEAGRALKRSGAQPGDTVFVSGTIGDGALGLLEAKNQLSGLSADHSKHLADRYRRPQPRVTTGQRLVGQAHACIDISDGLVQDLRHICAASGVSMRIDAGKIPLSDAARAALNKNKGLMETILTGGDDYELACTASDALSAGDVPLTAIGEVSTGDTGIVIADHDGNALSFKQQGYNHFSGT